MVKALRHLRTFRINVGEIQKIGFRFVCCINDSLVGGDTNSGSLKLTNKYESESAQKGYQNARCPTLKTNMLFINEKLTKSFVRKFLGAKISGYFQNIGNIDKIDDLFINLRTSINI